MFREKGDSHLIKQKKTKERKKGNLEFGFGVKMENEVIKVERVSEGSSEH